MSKRLQSTYKFSVHKENTNDSLNLSQSSIGMGVGPVQVNFNKEKVKYRMKEMIRKSEQMDNTSREKNNITNQTKPKFNSTIEIHNEKVNELGKLNELAEKNVDQQQILLKALMEENTDTVKLIQYYKKQTEIDRNKYEELDTEEKRVRYREEKIIEQTKKQMGENLVKIQSLKEECYGLEAEFTTKDYKLIALKLKSEEMNRNIEHVTIELEDKIKLKMFKENELSNKEKAHEETQVRVMDVHRINNEYIDYLRMIHNDLQESKGNIRVFCRVRPPLQKELKEENANHSNFIEFPNFNTIVLNGPTVKSNTGKNKEVTNREIYKFDRVFRPEDSQEEVFKEISQLVQSALDGYKVCIFAYGQTGSGKTYTMEGEDGDTRGIIPRSIEQIFEFKSTLESMGWLFSIEASCVEIYNDQVRDLLMNSNNNIISQNNNRIEKFAVFNVKSVDDLNPILETAAQKRAVAETLCNEKSSRSHCIFQLKITGKNTQTGQERHGALNLIDLAGSERVSNSKVEGDRLKETIAINKSLTHLKSVITALVNTNHKNNTHIPYRDSILTWILKEYLGGENKTLMFVNISPVITNFSESSCSLKFASDVNSCYIKSSEEK